ncbi:MAG: EamA family transporter [Burkholderiaceae bacterium]
MIDTATTLAVLAAALFHAGWNAILKKGGEPLFESALMHLWLLPAALVLIVWMPAPEPFTLVCVLASAVVHCVYFHVLAATYRHADLGITYPILRGSAPAMTALGAVVLMNEQPGAQGWAGIGLICGGVVSMGLLSAWTRPHSRPGNTPLVDADHDANQAGLMAKAIGWALCTALTIVAYTLIDSAGVRSAPHAWMYVTWLTIAQGLVVGAVVMWRQKIRFLAYARSRGPMPLLTGTALISGYGIALWAMTRAPVATVAALRETSILFALLIAHFVLGERGSSARWGAAGLIVAGVLVLRLA